jgi:signal transduction histidine kinase
MDTLIVLINDILDLAKVDAGKMILLMSHSKYRNYLPVLFVYLKQKFKKQLTINHGIR